jgi:hypothetical protein
VSVAKNAWGRWGNDDPIGALNLITPAKRVEAAGLVRSGRSISLSRPFPSIPASNNPTPAHHFLVRIDEDGGAGQATDYYGVSYHGRASTHLDALCHLWDSDGAWNGRDPDSFLRSTASSWASIDHVKDGIVTRAVLFDVPRARGVSYVTQDRPVHGSELSAIAAADDLRPRSGDALVIYSGRDAYDADPANPLWGTSRTRPGLHASCLDLVHEFDPSLLVMDMMDTVIHTVDVALHRFGVSFLNNADLGALARACRSEGRYEFLLVVAPLYVIGGTGSPVNPIAIL